MDNATNAPPFFEFRFVEGIKTPMVLLSVTTLVSVLLMLYAFFVALFLGLSLHHLELVLLDELVHLYHSTPD